MSAIWNCCCGQCSFTLPGYSFNDTVPDSGGAGHCDGSLVTPYTRDDIDCNSPPFTRCFGEWPLPSPPHSGGEAFATAAAATIDDCAYGVKFVVGKKIWPGRYGFTDDYVANPKVDTKFKQYTVSISVSFTMADTMSCYDLGGAFVGSKTTSKGTSGSAQSLRNLTVGGIEDCTGSAGAGDGYGAFSDSNGFSSPYWDDPNSSVPCSINSGCQAEILTAVNAPWDPNFDKDGARAANINKLKAWCAIDGDRGIIHLPIPDRAQENWFTGTPDQLGSFLASISSSYTGPKICQQGGSAIEYAYYIEQVDYNNAYSVDGFSVTNTEIKGTLKFVCTAHTRVWNVHEVDPDGNCIQGELIYESESKSNWDFTFSATLGGAVTFQDMADQAKGLLAVWDMTNKNIYPWQQPANCSIAPMVSLWEVDGSPGAGYCDTPADPTEKAIYDGSIKGAPINYYGFPIGSYHKGWFDYTAIIYHYASCDPTDPLCYGYGFYVSDYTGVTMATQLVDGAADDGCGTFSRYKVNWQAPSMPPYVYNSCAFIADGGDAIYAGKWAEKKVPLPAENFFGPCGIQRTQTLLNGSCNATATWRYRNGTGDPNAMGICGKLGVLTAVQSGPHVNITLAGVAYLKDGDLVDFSGTLAANGTGMTVEGLTSTIAAVSAFQITATLSVAYTGGGFVSGGAQAGVTRPDPKWYDLAPKGDFVRVTDYNGAVTVTDENVVPTSKSNGIIVIAPAGSPELTGWPGATTAKFSDYPSIGPGEYWLSGIQQGMGDRYWTHPQDEQQSDGAGGCAGNGQTNPIVCEARVTAPSGAPWDFSAGDGNKFNKLPAATEFGFACSGVWNLTSIFSALPYDKWPGVSTSSVNATADQYNIGHNADATDSGLGTA